MQPPNTHSGEGYIQTYKGSTQDVGLEWDCEGSERQEAKQQWLPFAQRSHACCDACPGAQAWGRRLCQARARTGRQASCIRGEIVHFAKARRQQWWQRRGATASTTHRASLRAAPSTQQDRVLKPLHTTCSPPSPAPLPPVQGRRSSSVQGCVQSGARLASTDRREVVLDVEDLPNLLWSLALHHGSNLGTGEVQERLDVQVVRGLCRCSCWVQPWSGSGHVHVDLTKMSSKSISCSTSTKEASH